MRATSRSTEPALYPKRLSAAPLAITWTLISPILLSARYLVLIPDCAVSEMPFISVMAETSRLPQALR